MWKKILLSIVFGVSAVITYAIYDTNKQLFIRDIQRQHMNIEKLPLPNGTPEVPLVKRFHEKYATKLPSDVYDHGDRFKNLIDDCYGVIEQTEQITRERHKKEFDAYIGNLYDQIREQNKIIEDLYEKLNPDIDFKGLVISAFIGQIITMLIIAPYQLFQYIKKRRNA